MSDHTILWTMRGGHTTMSRKELNRFIEEETSAGKIMKFGHSVDVGYKKIAPDVYRVFIKGESHE